MDSNKDLDSWKESSKKTRKKSRTKEDIVGPTSPKFVNQSNKGEAMEEEDAILGDSQDVCMVLSS